MKLNFKRILFVYATRIEGQNFKKNYLRWFPARFKTKIKFDFLQLGVGQTQAHNVLKQYLLDHDKNFPDLVIHFGLSGGLEPSLKPETIFFAKQIINDNNESLFVTETSALRENKVLATEFKTVKLLSINHVLKNPADKQKAYQKYKCEAVDMESFAVLKICQEKKIPYLSLRVVFDEVSFDLTKLKSEAFLNSKGDIKPASSAMYFLKNPRQLFEIPAIKRKTDRCLKKLYLSLAQIIVQFHFIEATP